MLLEPLIADLASIAMAQQPPKKGTQTMHSNSVTTHAITLLVTAALLALSSCSDGGSRSKPGSNITPANSIVGSCNNTLSGFCNEFTGTAYNAAAVQKSCEQQKMTFIAGPCPAESLVGSCLVYKGQSYESSYRYFANFPGTHLTEGTAATAAERQCTSLMGEWTPN